MRSLLQLFTALFFASSLPALAQDSAPPDNATSKSAETAGEVEILDSEVDIPDTDFEPPEEPFPLAGRVAFGVVNASGGRRSGSNNWSATYDRGFNA